LPLFTRKEAGAVLISAVVTLGLGLLPAGASGAVLYDQTSGTPDAGCISSSDFGVANKVAQGADDFPVPAGQTWQIGSIDVVGGGALTGSPTATVTIYGTGSLPGAQLFSQSGIPISGANNLTIPVTGAPSLATGTYWISVLVTDPVQWSWCEKQAQIGAVAAWRNPGGGFSLGCTTYTALTSCGSTGKSFLFRLNSPDPTPPAAPPSTTTTAKKKCKKKKHKRAASAKKRKCKKRKKP
jgi:hypothetical protein